MVGLKFCISTSQNMCLNISKPLVARSPSHTPPLQTKTWKLKPKHATLGSKAYTLDPRIQHPKLTFQTLKQKSCKLIMGIDASHVDLQTIAAKP